MAAGVRSDYQCIPIGMKRRKRRTKKKRRIAPEPNDSSNALTASVVFRKAPTHKRGRDAENGIDTVELYCCTGTVVIKHG